MKSLYYSFQTKVEHAYIITLKDNPISIQTSQRCQESCKNVDMPYIIWDAFDGTDNQTIKTPQQFENETFFKILKVNDNKLSISQVSTLLSHISLWLECARIDKPIVILEHDAIMLRKFEEMYSYNAIVYLGCQEWVKHGWKMCPIPPFGAGNENYRFILRAHAYAIDPPMAKNLLAHVLKYGIYETADFMVRADIFNITHQGIYAYDEPTITTINNPEGNVI